MLSRIRINRRADGQRPPQRGKSVIGLVIAVIIAIEVLWVGIYFLYPAHPQVQVRPARIVASVPHAKSNLYGDRAINQDRLRKLESQLNQAGVPAGQQKRILTKYRNSDSAQQEHDQSRAGIISALAPGRLDRILLIIALSE